MNTFLKLLLIVTFSTAILNCSSTKNLVFKTKEIYRTDNLIVTQISENSFVHVSFKQTNDFGKVPCNGLIVRDRGEVIIFDTPINDNSAEELINWINMGLQCKISAVIPTHFHDDSIGGLKAFHDIKIPSYAYSETIELAKKNKYEIPVNSFENSLTLNIGNKDVVVKFFGEGHTKDNVVGYFPSENILFGGCLLKELEASKGYLADANVNEWSNTIQKIILEYPNVKIVVPGHGEKGNKKLLNYTLQLFKTK